MAVRWLMFLLVVSLLVIQLADRVYLRSLTAAKLPVAVSMKTDSIYPLSMETQEIVNEEGVSNFARRAISRILNYRPALAVDHIDSEEVRTLLIGDEHFERFRQQFLSWSHHEFNVNDIVMKESTSTNGVMTKSAKNIDGMRVWQYRAKVPILDRGYGGTDSDILNVTLKMVYLGPDGGMGIYSVKISL